MVITVLLLIYHHNYINHFLTMGNYPEVAGGLLGIFSGSLLMAIVIMILVRLAEWGFSKM